MKSWEFSGTREIDLKVKQLGYVIHSYKQLFPPRRPLVSSQYY